MFKTFVSLLAEHASYQGNIIINKTEDLMLKIHSIVLTLVVFCFNEDRIKHRRDSIYPIYLFILYILSYKLYQGRCNPQNSAIS